jgi:hypothetical protein
MPIDPRQLLVRVVVPVLGHLGLDSAVARALVLGTIYQESNGVALAQRGGGPALGIVQMEPATEADIWDNFLRFQPDLAAKVTALLAPAPSRTMQLATNLAYAVAMVRVHYRRVPAPLPATADPAALGRYWKQHYNTPGGKGTVEEFVANFNRTVAAIL